MLLTGRCIKPSARRNSRSSEILVVVPTFFFISTISIRDFTFGFLLHSAVIYRSVVHGAVMLIYPDCGRNTIALWRRCVTCFPIAIFLGRLRIVEVLESPLFALRSLRKKTSLNPCKVWLDWSWKRRRQLTSKVLSSWNLAVLRLWLIVAVLITLMLWHVLTKHSCVWKVVLWRRKSRPNLRLETCRTVLFFQWERLCVSACRPYAGFC